MKLPAEVGQKFWEGFILFTGLSQLLASPSLPPLVCPALSCPAVNLSCPSELDYHSLAVAAKCDDKEADGRTFAVCYTAGTSVALGVGFWAGRATSRAFSQVATAGGSVSALALPQRRGYVVPRPLAIGGR